MPIPNIRKNKEIRVGKPSPPWMVTYSDLMTQILIFFVMMFALATALNELQLVALKEKLQAYVEEHHLKDMVHLEINQKGLVISLREKLMFDRGKAEIYPYAKKILGDLAGYLMHGREGKPYPNDVRIEGHTCNLPIHTKEFPSNWELSTARATNVTRYLVEETHFLPEKISSAGYGEYQPVSPNDTEAHRALNRRIDIIVRRISARGSKPTVIKEALTR